MTVTLKVDLKGTALELKKRVKQKTLLVFLVFFSLLSTNSHAEPNIQAGKATYDELCSSCHGRKAKGHKRLNAPALAGQQNWYLLRQLNNFKSGIRGTHADDIYGNQMRPMAMMLTTEQSMLDVVAYLASLPIRKPSKPKGDITLGEANYVACATCHGQYAEGNKALNAPQLKGLQPWYLVTQLKNFKSGARGTHADDIYGKQMQPMSMILSDEQAAKDIAYYISSLGNAPAS